MPSILVIDVDEPKLGTEYEFGLWSLRNLEAIARDNVDRIIQPNQIQNSLIANIVLDVLRRTSKMPRDENYDLFVANSVAQEYERLTK